MTRLEGGLDQGWRLDEELRHRCYDWGCDLENFAASFDAERDLLHQGWIESTEYVWRMDVPFTWDECKDEFLRSHYDHSRGFSLAAVEVAWCVFRLCVESVPNGRPDWSDVLYWAERSPFTKGMVRAVFADVNENLTMSDETFEERMGPFEDRREASDRYDWQTEGF